MCAVHNMAVFWSSLTSCFPGMLLMYFLNDSEIVPVTHIISGITFVFTFHMRCISIVRSLYCYYHQHHHHHHRISHFSALAGKYSPILGCSNQQDYAGCSYL